MSAHRAGWCVAVAALAAGMSAAAPAATAPVPGATYVYRLVNGYNKEVVGQLHYRVERVDPAAYTVTVSPDTAAAGWTRTEVHTRDGNSLKRLLENHGEKVEYLFSAAYPAYAFPLEPGRSWSTRVNATVPGRRGERSVRVDGKVLAAERIRVPAGEFDTVRIARVVYPGDADFHLPETRVVETEWYAPALGRAVRTEVRSSWLDLSRCDHQSSCEYYGDWDVFELVKAPAGG